MTTVGVAVAAAKAGAEAATAERPARRGEAPDVKA